MTSLLSLPNELSWKIISGVGIEDVISLSRASKQLYQYVYSDLVSKDVALAKIPFSREFVTATQSGTSYSQALRRWAKKTEAVATANPYSIAIIGVGQTYLYSNGSLWYMHDTKLRLLETRQSPTEELVIDLPSLLAMTAFASQPKIAGSFSFLYYNEGVLSCLYRFSHPQRGGWLIAVDVKKPTILLSVEVVSTEKLFARHDREYLYYGVHTSNDYDDRKRWVLHGYELKDGSGKSLGRNNFLHDLIGAEIGSSICFEVIDGFFYAISNQTTYEVEEVDWTSFYHGRRFPLGNPSEEMLEKTEDECMWRRQHLEGPLDDRWTSLALATDETTGQLTIVESRKEWLDDSSIAQRTVYKTKVVFPQRPTTKGNTSCQGNTEYATSYASQDSLPFGTTNLHGAVQTSLSDYLSSVNMPTPSDEEERRQILVALTHDRLALTITAANKPHYLPPQIRPPRDVHSEPIQARQYTYVLSKTPARHYNLSANSFIDFVNDIPHADPEVSQCLRIRVCSRGRKSPAFAQDGIMPPSNRDPTMSEETNGSDEEYEDREMKMWPPSLPAGGYQSQAYQDLHKLMNPPNYIGSVHGTFDENSLVYSTGQDGQPKAIVLVNFDPAVRLQGLKKWPNTANASGSHNVAHATPLAPEATSQPQVPGARSPKRPNPAQSPITADNQGEFQPQKRAKTTTHVSRSQSTCASPQAGSHDSNSSTTPVATGQGWLRRETAMYMSIARGFDFGISL